MRSFDYTGAEKEMIKSPVYDELAQAAAFSLSSISRIFMRTAPA